MIPATVDLKIYKGDTANVYFRVRIRNSDGTPGAYVDLTGGTPKAQIRASTSSNTVIVEFTATLDDQGARPGGVLLTLSAAETAGVAASTGVWDAQVTLAGVVTTYIGGKVTFTEDVTRA